MDMGPPTFTIVMVSNSPNSIVMLAFDWNYRQVEMKFLCIYCLSLQTRLALVFYYIGNKKGQNKEMGKDFSKNVSKYFRSTIEIFCFKNCSDLLLWEKKNSTDRKNFWNSKAKAENLQNLWDQENNLLEQR